MNCPATDRARICLLPAGHVCDHEWGTVEPGYPKEEPMAAALREAERRLFDIPQSKDDKLFILGVAAGVAMLQSLIEDIEAGRWKP